MPIVQVEQQKQNKIQTEMEIQSYVCLEFGEQDYVKIQQPQWVQNSKDFIRIRIPHSHDQSLVWQLIGRHLILNKTYGIESYSELPLEFKQPPSVLRYQIKIDGLNWDKFKLYQHPIVKTKLDFFIAVDDKENVLLGLFFHKHNNYSLMEQGMTYKLADNWMVPYIKTNDQNIHIDTLMHRRVIQIKKESQDPINYFLADILKNKNHILHDHLKIDNEFEVKFKDTTLEPEQETTIEGESITYFLQQSMSEMDSYMKPFDKFNDIDGMFKVLDKCQQLIQIETEHGFKYKSNIQDNPIIVQLQKHDVIQIPNQITSPQKIFMQLRYDGNVYDIDFGNSEMIYFYVIYNKITVQHKKQGDQYLLCHITNDIKKRTLSFFQCQQMNLQIILWYIEIEKQQKYELVQIIKEWIRYCKQIEQNLN